MSSRGRAISNNGNHSRGRGERSAGRGRSSQRISRNATNGVSDHRRIRGGSPSELGYNLANNDGRGRGGSHLQGRHIDQPSQHYNGDALFDNEEFPALDDLEATSRARTVKYEQNRRLKFGSDTSYRAHGNAVRRGAQEDSRNQYSRGTSQPRPRNTSANHQGLQQQQIHYTGRTSPATESRGASRGRRVGNTQTRRSESNRSLGVRTDVVSARNRMEPGAISSQVSPMLFWNMDLIVSPPSMPGVDPMPGDTEMDKYDAFLYNYNVTVAETTRVNKIKSQIEFYFSAYNLKNDIFLRNHMDNEGYVPYNLIRSFPRIQALQATTDDVRKALADSSSVEIAENPLRTRRRVNPDKWTSQGLYIEIMRIFYTYMADKRFNEWYLLAEDALYRAALQHNMRYVHPALVNSPYYEQIVHQGMTASEQLMNICRFVAPTQPMYFYLDPAIVDPNASMQSFTSNAGEDSNTAFMSMISGIVQKESGGEHTYVSNQESGLVRDLETLHISTSDEISGRGVLSNSRISEAIEGTVHVVNREVLQERRVNAEEERTGNSGVKAFDGNVITGKAIDGNLNTGKASTGNVITGKAFDGKAFDGKALSGKAPSGKAPSGKAPIGKTLIGKASSGKAPSGNVSSGKAPSGNVSSGKTASGNVSSGKAPSGNVSSGKAPSGNVSSGKAPSGNVSSAKVSGVTGNVSTVQ